jgi:drug/metabolite transporter (DMT)-like permease
MKNNIIKNQKVYAYILIILTTFFWGSNIVAGKLMNEYIPPITATCFRWIIVIIILFPLVIKKLITNIKIIGQYWLPLFALGLTGIALNTALLYLGLTYTTAMNGALIGATSPIFIVLAAFLFLRESISSSKLFGLILSSMGVIFIISQGNFTSMLHLSFNIGDLILLISVAMWAVYSTILKFLPKIFDPLLLLFIASVFAEFFLIPASLFESHFSRSIIIFNPISISLLIYIVIFPAIIGYASWDIGLKKLGNTTCGILYNLSILFGSILAVLMLKESLHVFHLIGFVLILAGSGLTLEINFKKNA